VTLTPPLIAGKGDNMQTSTTVTATYTSNMPPIYVSVVPNMDNPLFANDPDRVDGIWAALNYLAEKGVDVRMEYGDFYNVIYD
jgi:hypothetical protein